MANFLPKIFSCLLLLCILRVSNAKPVETRALLELRKWLNDPLNYLQSWDVSQSPCQFVGVTCDPEYGTVVGISLVNMSLSGQISPSISDLGSLSTLELQTNSLSGAVPTQLANCSSLRHLNLSSNTLTGELPDLSPLQSLLSLDLSSNRFSGQFPAWVGKLPGLQQLVLGKNGFDQGELPPSIGNLKNLTLLYLAWCNLTGEIPASIFELSSLSTLDLSTNNISGEFPKDISNLRNLWKIELYQNNLTGEIPPELANLRSLREFDVSRNLMTGKLPPEISDMNFTVFQIFQNGFWGELPQGFGDMRFLKAFSIYGNGFSGEFPPSFGRFSPLDSFDISENRFSGQFPRFLCQRDSLRFLLALDNGFSGEFPDSYSSCKSLQRLRISKNSFTGRVPDGLWGLPLAVVIDVADNGFVGGISSDIGISASLTQLYVQNNEFSSELPPEIGMLSQLQKLVANNNSFSGQIPSQIGRLALLSSLHLEMNSLTGPIPAEIVGCSSLVDLNLAWNSLTGEIPGNVALLPSLNSLNLSSNMLSGPIPGVLQSLKLSSLDLSENRLSGRIPPELLMIGRAGAFSGNPGLCTDGVPGIRLGPEVGACASSPGHGGVFRTRTVVLVVTSIMLSLLAGLALVSYKSFKSEQGGSKVDIEGGADGGSSCNLQSFHPTELDAEEICKLEEGKLIGSGGTGKVYRLDLSKNRGSVAVKQLWKGKGAKALMAEIGILGKIRHRNILKLYACVTKGECRYLVYELMPNGNLYDALRREVKAGKSELDWGRRYSIALGAAKGVMYLHHDCSPAIVHRDIKSSNILLDADYEAKIADFGIAKVAEESDYSCFAGTYGYLAPELAYSLKVTEKSDVYSYGVVLLELLTGRGPTGPEFGEGKDIVSWVSAQLNEPVVGDMLDPRVSGAAGDDMIKVLRIAILCTANLPSLRPTMREVVNLLVDANPCAAAGRMKNFRKK